jgi:dTDP-4-dehydrorhamnose reductase
MRILILGGDGMLGHQLLRHFEQRYETRVTLRQNLSCYARYSLFHAGNSYADVDVRSTDRLIEVLSDFRPQAVVNAVGIVKHRAEAKEAIPSLEINALVPHRLTLACRMLDARLVHMSTDCVFSGNRGAYTEDDISDATDLYGRSKYLGEISDECCITLRTSIIGLELARRASLIEWYLAQRGTIRGFNRAIFTGLSTAEMARVIERVLTQYPDLSGVWQVASTPISKYALLARLTQKLGRTDLSIECDETFICDRSLDGSHFNQRAAYAPPSWDAMLDELVQQIRERGNTQ